MTYHQCESYWVHVMNREQCQAPTDPVSLQSLWSFIIITQLESWYSFTIPRRVEGWADLGSAGRRCAQPGPKALNHSGFYINPTCHSAGSTPGPHALQSGMLRLRPAGREVDMGRRFSVVPACDTWTDKQKSLVNIASSIGRCLYKKLSWCWQQARRI